MVKPAILFISGVLAFLPGAAVGQAWELFEDASIPAGWSVSGSGAGIRTVDTRSLRGDRSLEWAWTQPSTTLTWNLSPAATGSGHRVFSQWVRLETPLPTTRLRVELRSTNGSIRTFEKNLDFNGWRTAFVPYSSMTGSGTNSIDRVRWTLVGAPPSSGRLYLDQVIVGQSMDTRFQYADVQVPFVWEDRTKSMWENQVHWHRRQPAPVEASLEEILAARNLRDDWDARLIGSGTISTTTVDQWETRMSEFNIRREGGIVRGNPVFYRNYAGYAYPPGLAAGLAGTQAPNDFQDYTSLMLEMARGWHRTTDAIHRARISGMLVLMAEHLLDQGWAAGSNQGCLFLIGYYSREFMRAVYLARDIFADAGLLEEMGEAARWYGQAGSLLDEGRAPNMDFFNTLAQGQMLSLLMEPDEQVQVAWLRIFSASISRQIADLRPGDTNGFKPDGTAFHHNGHYPAYAIGGISTLGQIFDVLHGTPFAFDQGARLAFREVLLAARAYSQLLDWPIGISGRHPFSGGISSARGAFAALSRYPDPVEMSPPDRQVAAAYVRLWGQPSGALGTLFNDVGIQAETLSGFFTFPFANHAVYRSGNWMVSLKGYSRYVWSSEIYAADNRYGRYQSNGTAEILLGAGRAASGFRENGWDWNRLPGTTGVHLPLDQLESPNAGTLMLRSSETMAGGVTAGLDGVFGFILNEDRFGHTLRARKSVFTANGILVSLGSGIGSDHATAPAETTLFQVALGANRDPITLSLDPNSPVTAFPWNLNTSSGTSFWVLDPAGNGFWMPPGQDVRLSRSTQESRHNKTKAPTTGDFSVGWLHHGVGIEGKTYEYVILPQASAAQMSHFNSRMASSAPAYRVLQREDGLHAVHFVSPNRYGFAVFAPGRWETLPHLIEADSASLLWLEEKEGGIILSVANPDLNPGETMNLVSPTAFLLRGLWENGSAEFFRALIWHENGNTRIVFPAREGATIRLSLRPASTLTPWSGQVGNDSVSPVENFRLVTPGAPFLAWDDFENSGLGYVVERMLVQDGTFTPIGIVAAETLTFFDRDLPANSLAYYRVRKWTNSGLGSPSRSLLVFDPGSESRSYDFRTMSDVDELREQGWTSSGLQSADDWYFTPEGMFLIDNHPDLPANVTVPFLRERTGRVTARMGVARTANFHARIELLAGEQSLGMIQMTGRTVGFLRGLTDVEFTDDRWDIEQGTLRDVSIDWREIPGHDRLEITLRYFGTSEAANRVLRWEIPNVTANHPDRLRLSAGFSSAVNRGLVVESLEIFSSVAPSLLEFYLAWAEVFLGDRNAPPAADATGNGVPNLWEFIWARDTADPRVPHPRAKTPGVDRTNGASRFFWEVPDFEDIAFHLEATESLNQSWQVIPHAEEPLGGVPGWIRVASPPFNFERSSYFYRLILSTGFD